MGYTPLYYGKRSIIDSVDAIMEKYKSNTELKMRLRNLILARCTKQELLEGLEELFGQKLGDIDNHFNDGKTFLDNEIVDDFYSFDVEIDTGDIYTNIYFVNTNEKDIILITEVYVEFNDWKK